jgi:hypothetical protein
MWDGIFFMTIFMKISKLINHWEDPAVDGRIILRWIFRKWEVGGIDWIELAEDRDR